MTTIAPPKKRVRHSALKKLKREWVLHLLMLPSLVLVAIFCYQPMIGAIIAFQKFTVFKGWFAAKWIGLDNFRVVMSLPNFWPVMFNTVYIAILKILFNMIIPILTALMLNEMRQLRIKKLIQTTIYMPNFLSWIVFGGIVLDVLGADGIVNRVLTTLGFGSVNFLTNPHTFRGMLIVTDVWKNFGFGTIIYLASLTAIDPALYEAAMIDGAGRLRQTWHITLPGMKPIIVLLATLNLGNVLNAGFDQVFLLLNALTMGVGDILDTLVYRMAFDQAQYSMSAAIGLFKSAISCVLIVSSYYLAYRYADYRIF
jgi:putative aldouronate transport system permease protein